MSVGVKYSLLGSSSVLKSCAVATAWNSHLNVCHVENFPSCLGKALMSSFVVVGIIVDEEVVDNIDATGLACASYVVVVGKDDVSIRSVLRSNVGGGLMLLVVLLVDVGVPVEVGDGSEPSSM